MIVYRIVKTLARADDLSGKGAFLVGGRWNPEGIFMLYTSVNKSLAFLENLVHFDLSELPEDMYIMEISVDDNAPIYTFPDKDLPDNWREPENIELKLWGYKLFKSKKYLGIKVRSAVIPGEYNLLLDPTYPRFYDLVKIVRKEMLKVDQRFVRNPD